MTRSATVSNPPPAVFPLTEAPNDSERLRLPFTVIDEVVHTLDTPAEPWSIQLELGLDGRLDEDRLRAAVRTALQRHPMARARQLPDRLTDGRWWWEILSEPDLDPLRVVECSDHEAVAAARAELQSRSVPLVESPPFRLWLVRRPEGHDLLMLNASHSAFDGYGCVRLLQSVARAYASQPDPPPAVDLEEARDVTRHLAADDEATRFRRLRMLGGKVADTVRPPSQLAPEGASPAPGYGFHHLALDPDEGARLQEVEGASVNDVLLAALNLAIAGWNEEHGSPAGRIGVLVPVNLRPEEWEEDIVTNFVLEARVATDPDQRSSVGSVLDVVKEQTELLKKGAGGSLIEVLGGWRSLPLWGKRALSPILSASGRVVCTALLSNLGSLKAPPDFGEDVGPTSEVWFSAPARMPCGLSIGAATVGERLHLAFRYRHPLFGADAARKFAERYRVELQRVVKEA